MATMSIKKTGSNMSSWDYYVAGKSDWKRYENILKVEVKKPTPIYLDAQGKKASAASFANKTPVTLLDNKSYVIGGKVHAKVKIKSTVGYLPIASLGKPAKNTTAKEDIALRQLDSEIKSRALGGKGICIIVKSHGKVAFAFHDCVGARTFVGTPKADFSIIDSRGKDVAFISHKDAGGASAYQQYVSLTGGGNDPVNTHPIVKEFLAKVAINRDDIVKNRKRFKKTIPFTKSGIELINNAVYGIEFGKAFSKEHCHFIGQGKPTLVEASPKDRPTGVGVAYELKFSDDLSISGDVSHFTSGGFEPIILARFTAGRSFYVNGVRHSDVRLLIAPKVLSSTAEEI
jgi:hypothetical protein